MTTGWHIIAAVALSAAALAGSCCLAAEPALQASPLGTLVDGNTEFAVALYKQIALGEGNVVFSPLSVSVATAMLDAGAAGETRAEIESAAHFALPSKVLPSAFSGLLGELEARVERWENRVGTVGTVSDVRGPKLSFANGLWVDPRCRVKPEFVRVLSDGFKARADTVDFGGAPAEASRRINAFISERTNGKISSVVDPSMFTDLTRLVLANTVYFLAAWKDLFSEGMTAEGDFHRIDGSTVSVRMMKTSGEYRYFADESVQVLELPYQGNGFSMLLALPASDHPLAELELRLRPSTVAGWLRGLERRGVELAIPKFEVTQEFDLIPLLQSLGMKRAFEVDRAQFPAICGASDLYVSQARHSARLGISEKGTEAAAASVYVVFESEHSPPDETVAFRADRPFLFLVRDMERGGVLFMGRVVDPAAGGSGAKEG